MEILFGVCMGNSEKIGHLRRGGRGPKKSRSKEHHVGKTPFFFLANAELPPDSD